ncbi:neuronal acetylcholine receptor subunit alpha-7a [Gasterosteus aculeatus]
MDSLHLLLFLAVAALAVQVSLQGPGERRLFKDLMTDYNPLERPVSNDSQNLTVELGLSLIQIIDVDEKNQVLTTSIWLQMQWEDSYLRWNASDYTGVTNIRFPQDLLWKPDILLYNSADENFDATSHTKILVNTSGNCFHLPPGILKSSCRMDLRWFPFDVQKCELKFGSWTYGGWSVDLKLLQADTSSYIPNGEWDLVEIKGQRNEHTYVCCEEPYPDITYTLVMRRRTLFYGLNLLLPCVLISTLALLVFLLPADSGEKISLGITVLLSLAVFMLLVAEIMPATSDSVPLLAQYFATIMVIVGLSIMATVVVLQYHHHDPDGGKMPKWIRVILLNWCAWFLRMKRPGEGRPRPARHDEAPQNSVTGVTSVDLGAPAPQSTNGKLLYVGIRGLDSIKYAATSPDSGVLCARLAGGAGEDELLLPAGHGSPAGSVEPELAKILEEVRYIAKRFRHQDDDKSVCNEWKFAASVIDRLCLLAFSLFTILFTIGILMSAPNFVDAVSKDFST